MKVTFFSGTESTSVVTAPQIIGGGTALPPGEEGQVLGYGPGGVPRALDAAGSPYDDTGIKQRVQALEDAVPSKADVGHGHAVSAITGLQGILDGKAAVGHQHDFAAVSGLQAALDGKAPATHTHGIAGVTGLQAALNGKADATAIPSVEFLQDLVAAMFQAGTHSNASISYDDATGALNIIATGSGSGGSTLTQENVEDFVGGLVVQGTGISVTYDDAGNVLRIALAGESYTTADRNKLAGIAAGATVNQTDTHLLNRANHTGTQAIATIEGLLGELESLASRIAALESSAPVASYFLRQPVLSGERYIGATLTLDPGEIAGNPVPTRTVQWLRGGVVIAGATELTYTTTVDDGGLAITARVIGSNGTLPDAIATSNQIAIIAPVVNVATPTGYRGVQDYQIDRSLSYNWGNTNLEIYLPNWAGGDTDYLGGS